MRNVHRTGIILILATLLSIACDPPPPELVWVPAPDFKAGLEVSIDGGSNGTYRVGEWIILHAVRSTGPWKQVPYEDLPEGASWMREPPPSREEDVEANVRWLAYPPGYHELNLPHESDIRARRVRFKSPGEYRLWAESHTWGGGQARSNEVEVRINE